MAEESASFAHTYAARRAKALFSRHRDLEVGCEREKRQLDWECYTVTNHLDKEINRFRANRNRGIERRRQQITPLVLVKDPSGKIVDMTKVSPAAETGEGLPGGKGHRRVGAIENRCLSAPLSDKAKNLNNNRVGPRRSMDVNMRYPDTTTSGRILDPHSLERIFRKHQLDGTKYKDMIKMHAILKKEQVNSKVQHFLQDIDVYKTRICSKTEPNVAKEFKPKKNVSISDFSLLRSRTEENCKNLSKAAKQPAKCTVQAEGTKYTNKCSKTMMVSKHPSKRFVKSACTVCPEKLTRDRARLTAPSQSRTDKTGAPTEKAMAQGALLEAWQLFTTDVCDDSFRKLLAFASKQKARKRPPSWTSVVSQTVVNQRAVSKFKKHLEHAHLKKMGLVRPTAHGLEQEWQLERSEETGTGQTDSPRTRTRVTTREV